MNHEISWIFQLYNMQNLSGSPDGSSSPSHFLAWWKRTSGGPQAQLAEWIGLAPTEMQFNMFNHLHPLLIAAQSPLLKRLNVWTGCVGTGIALAWGSGKYPTCSYSTTEHEPTRYPVSCNPYALLRVITCWPSVQDWNHENQRTSNRHEQERILRN